MRKSWTTWWRTWHRCACGRGVRTADDRDETFPALFDFVGRRGWRRGRHLRAPAEGGIGARQLADVFGGIQQPSPQLAQRGERGKRVGAEASVGAPDESHR